MDDTEFIYSWFINPHTIWIRRSRANEDLVLFEHELDQYYRKNTHPDVGYKPKVGDVSIVCFVVNASLYLNEPSLSLIDGCLL